MPRAKRLDVPKSSQIAKERRHWGERPGGPKFSITMRDHVLESSDFVADRDGHRWEVIFLWEQGWWRPEVSEIRVRTADTPHWPPSATVVRSLPIGEMEREAREAMPGAREYIEAWATRDGNPQSLWADALTQLVPIVEGEELGPQKGRKLDHEQLERIAAVYRAAHARGEPVTRAVALTFNVSSSTAGKRIMAARKAGLLNDIDKPKGQQ